MLTSSQNSKQLRPLKLCEREQSASTGAASRVSENARHHIDGAELLSVGRKGRVPPGCAGRPRPCYWADVEIVPPIPGIRTGSDAEEAEVCGCRQGCGESRRVGARVLRW